MDAFLKQIEPCSVQYGYGFAKDGTDPASLDVLESTSDGTFVEKAIELANLDNWANDREGSPVPKFKLFHIIIHDRNTRCMHISKSRFNTIFLGFQIESCAKHFTSQIRMGFFQPRKDCADDVWTFVLDAGRGAVIWSYSIRTACTRAVFVGVPNYGKSFRKQLARYRSCAGHPLFPGFVLSVSNVLTGLDVLREQGVKAAKLEVATGYKANYFAYSPNEGNGPSNLAQSSKDAAAISNTLTTERYYINVLRKFLELLTDCSPHPFPAEPALWKDVADVAHSLQQLIENQALSGMTVEKRVENQMTIIFNLIAREDTAATIRLAEAARRDSSSMKTLAVMTMAFLPATFLATVFAIPGLTRDQPPGFSVYLAVSIPTTVAILLAWAGITQRQVIRDLLRDIGRRKGLRKGKTVDSGIKMA